MIDHAWIVLLFPLFSFMILLFFGQKWKNAAAYIGMMLTFLSFVSAVWVLVQQWSGMAADVDWHWLVIGGKTLTVGFTVHPLNALMLVIVTLVSFLIHTYSKAYMKDDSRMGIFFAYLGLFTFSMLGLVISPNLLEFYMFWELVGVCSFLLIGFYFYRAEAGAAARKAFIVTRIGDVALFIGMILLFLKTGSFHFDVIFQAIEAGELSQGMITLTAILVFIGAVGKSGQFPLHTWLPDAMEGPTPVSALIHAATMVAAGVFLVATMYPLFLASHAAMMMIAIVGGFTAIFAASICLVQKDIKRVLAYSTVSQLGYMMLALGVGGYVAGIFHLMTHAFFKALLFLAAGSVIHAVHTQDIEEMGGLWKKMKWTGPLFLIGSLAISGFPLLSGFFSKDDIFLATAEDGRWILFWVAMVAAFFTAFYMFRLFFLVFMGETRHEKEDAREAPFSMKGPMIILGVFTVFVGYVNTPWFGTFLSDWLRKTPYDLGIGESGGSLWITPVAIAVSLGGIYLAWLIYGQRKISRQWLSAKIPFMYQTLFHKYYIDELYEKTIAYAMRVFSHFWKAFDDLVIETLVRLCMAVVDGIGGATRRLQTGQVQTYGAAAFIGLVVVIVILAVSGGVFR